MSILGEKNTIFVILTQKVARVLYVVYNSLNYSAIGLSDRCRSLATELLYSALQPYSGDVGFGSDKYLDF